MGPSIWLPFCHSYDVFIRQRTYLHQVRFGGGEELNVASAHELFMSLHCLTLPLFILQLHKSLACGPTIRILKQPRGKVGGTGQLGHTEVG